MCVCFGVGVTQIPLEGRWDTNVLLIMKTEPVISLWLPSEDKNSNAQWERVATFGCVFMIHNMNPLEQRQRGKGFENGCSLATI